MFDFRHVEGACPCCRERGCLHLNKNDKVVCVACFAVWVRSHFDELRTEDEDSI